MNRRQNIVIVAFMISMAVLLYCQPAQASKQVEDQTTVPDPGLAAIETAAGNGQFLMVLFRKTADPSPVSRSFETVRESVSPAVASLIIDTENPDQSHLVEKYNVRHAPLPMVVILAPNGAITGNFTTMFSREHVEANLVSPSTQECLLALQQQKIVFLCVQGDSTSDNTEALEGVTRFRNDPQFEPISHVVMIDPENPEERRLLAQLRIDSDPAVAETVLIAPPGKVVGKWSGPTSEVAIANTLFAQMKARNSCPIPDCGDPTCETPDQGGAK